MIVSLVAAMGENRVIGAQGSLPWHLPRDMRHFKTLTTGHPVVMGRKTFETLNVPLPNRHNLVITKDPTYAADGADVVDSLEAALAAVGDDDVVFVAGGGEIYRVALPRAHRIYLTVVHGRFEGDTSFPEFSMERWQLVEDFRYEPDERHRWAHSFRLYRRRSDIEDAR
jgi:dihydrofolate reductase